jgi:hypothetical protein
LSYLDPVCCISWMCRLWFLWDWGSFQPLFLLTYFFSFWKFQFPMLMCLTMQHTSPKALLTSLHPFLSFVAGNTFVWLVPLGHLATRMAKIWPQSWLRHWSFWGLFLDIPTSFGEWNKLPSCGPLPVAERVSLWGPLNPCSLPRNLSHLPVSLKVWL